MSYQSVVLLDSPVRYYRLGDTGVSTATDLGSQNVTGSYTGSYSLGQAGALVGDANTAAFFDGSTAWLSAAATSLPSGNTAWSIECWFWITAGSGKRIAMAWGNAAANQNVEIGVDGNAQLIAGFGGGSELTRTSFIGSLSTSFWYYAVCTYDGYAMRIYWNGIGYGMMVPTAGNVTLTSFSVGSGPSGSNFWNGRVDEAAVYNFALSPARVQAHWQAGVNAASTYGAIALSTNPTHYFPLDEPSGTTVTDAVYQRTPANGTYVGAPSLNQTTGLVSAGSAVTLNGTSQYAVLPTTGLPTGNNFFTFDIWAKKTANPSSGYGTLVQIGNPGTAKQSVRLAFDTAGHILEDWWGSTAVGPVIANGVWHNYAVVYNGTYLVLMIDGVDSGIIFGTTGGLSLSYGFCTLGADNQSGSYTNFFNGTIDEFSITSGNAGDGDTTARRAVLGADANPNYYRTIMSEYPLFYVRLDDPSWATNASLYSHTQYWGQYGFYQGSETLGAVGGLAASPDTAVQFAGTGTNWILFGSLGPTGHVPYSIECLLKFTINPANVMVLVAWGPTDGSEANNNTAQLFLDTAKKLHMGTWGNAGDAISGALNLNQWYHVIGTYDLTNYRLYIDGTLVATGASNTSVNISATNMNVNIGLHLNNTLPALGVAVDEVSISGVAYNQTAVTAHYLAARSPVRTVSTSLAVSGPNKIVGTVIGTGVTQLTMPFICTATGVGTVSMSLTNSPACTAIGTGVTRLTLELQLATFGSGAASSATYANTIQGSAFSWTSSLASLTLGFPGLLTSGVGVASATLTVSGAMAGQATGASVASLQLANSIAGTTVGEGVVLATLQNMPSAAAFGIGVASLVLSNVVQGTATGVGVATYGYAPTIVGTTSGVGAAALTYQDSPTGTAVGVGSAGLTLGNSPACTATGVGTASLQLSNSPAGESDGVGSVTLLLGMQFVTVGVGAATLTTPERIQGQAGGAGVATLTLGRIVATSTGVGVATLTYSMPTLGGVSSGSGALTSLVLVVPIMGTAQGSGVGTQWILPPIYVVPPAGGSTAESSGVSGTSTDVSVTGTTAIR